MLNRSNRLTEKTVDNIWIYIYNYYNIMETYARAKINLCLAITGIKNGRHLIDSVFAETFLADRVVVEKSTNGISVVYTDGRKYENDTALKAALLLSGLYGIRGVSITVEKNIPEGAGLGGSSGDAGAVLRGMEKVFGLPETPTNLSLTIGSDVPYCRVGGNKRVSGLGETIKDVLLPKLYHVLVLPKSGVSTAECYALYDKIGGENADVDAFLREIRYGLPECKNALQKSAVKLNGAVGRGLELLKKAGFSAGMTGSGSAVFGLEKNFSEYSKKINLLREYAQDESFAVYTQKEPNE